MWCGKCNYQNADGMRFCQNCGNSLFDFPQQVVPIDNNETQTRSAFQEVQTVVSSKRNEPQTFYTPQSNFQPAYSSPKPSKSYKKPLLILSGIAVVVVLTGMVGVAALVIFGLSANNKKSNPLLSPTPEVTKSPRKETNSENEPKNTPKDTPFTGFTPPSEPTKKGTFTVYANKGWQLSDIDTVPLENFRTNVQGVVDLADVKTGVNSKGVNDAKTASRRIYSEFPTGALLMRTRYADGNYSNVMAVTANKSTGFWQNYPDERGKLEFCVNDKSPEQNGGQFTVTVTLISVPKQKGKK